jgi:hypothetical protein
MIPAELDGSTQSPDEIDIYRRLKDDPAAGNWTVIHSLNVADHATQIEGEIDFVAIVPGKGVLCRLGSVYSSASSSTIIVLPAASTYRIKQILQRADDLLQIFILTSHPARYRGIVPTDCQFDLEAIRNGTV